MANKLMESAKLGAWITATILLLNQILAFAKVEVVQLFGISAPTGISPSIATSLIQTINGWGIVNIDLMSIVYLFIAATLTVFVGSFIYGMVNFPKTQKAWTKLTAILLWGTVAFYLLLVGLQWTGAITIVMLAVYYGAVVLTMGLLQKTVTKFIKL